MAEPAGPEPVVLFSGEDEVLLGDAVRDLVHTLVGDDDRTLVVDELGIDRYTAGGDPDVGPVIDAAQTPPFLTDRRVVVARHLGALGSKEHIAALVRYLADPLPTTVLVLVWERSGRPGERVAKSPPKPLADAVRAAGGRVVDTTPGKIGDVVTEAVAASGITLDAAARVRLAEHLGTEASRVRATLEALEAAYGPGARLGVAEIEPYLGAEGGRERWALTDAIDRGDTAAALDVLHRLLHGADPLHPLQVMATLHGHYARMLALDGAAVGSRAEAARLIGARSEYTAGKALDTARRLGSDRLRGFIGLLARADLDLRGARAWPPELVLEVLVARLASRSGTAASGSGGGRSRKGGGARGTGRGSRPRR